MAGVLPLPRRMRLIERRQPKRYEPADDEKVRFPAVEERWETSCGEPEEWDEAAALEDRGLPTVVRRISGSAVA
jgi:hypothetical protein